MDYKPKLISQFPDFKAEGFEMERYNDNFRQHNIIIHAQAKDIAYSEHWGGLSVKCAFGGNENYLTNNGFFAVNDANYLIFNEGRVYASYIRAENPVNSFTLNFTPAYLATVLNDLKITSGQALDSPERRITDSFTFVEKLYPHNHLVSPILQRLYVLSQDWQTYENLIEEQYYNLLEALIKSQQNVWQEIDNVQVIKKTTKIELYKRLHLAKDYLDSCFQQPLDLAKLAEVACLSPHYFLRQFKSYFQITPYFYLQQKRLQEARKLLEISDLSITEICYQVGYNDLSSFSKLCKANWGFSPEKLLKRKR